MKRIIYNILIILGGIFVSYVTMVSASALVIPGADVIKEWSIWVTVDGGDVVDVGLGFGMRILNLLKLVISGFALVFMVMIGVQMVIFSENEERIKTQRRQVVYVLMGFLFLNIPGALYSVVNPWDASGQTIDTNWWSEPTLFWYNAGLPGFIWWIIWFFRVFAYGSAILMLTWWFFRLILSSGEEEQVKAAKSRVIYSSLALMFLLFVDIWVRTFSWGTLASSVPGIAGTLFKLALFFAAPVAIFFIIYGAYYYITSAWDEERIKKWKSILVNTLIASLILIASFSFLSDISWFSF